MNNNIEDYFIAGFLCAGGGADEAKNQARQFVECLKHAYCDGWIDSEKKKPPLITGKDFSENVWGWTGDTILVVSFFNDGDGWHWANAYGDVFGDAEFDDDYDIKYWQPIIIPLPPNAKL